MARTSQFAKMRKKLKFKIRIRNREGQLVKAAENDYAN